MKTHLSRCFAFRAYDYCRIGELSAAQADAEQGIALGGASDYKIGLGTSYLALGIIAMLQGAFAEAQQSLQQGIGLLKESNEHFYLGVALREAGRLALLVGNP